ncbi:MAG TPA: polyhydroxyalkanoic acid system family protein [Usitatibacter sp.]|nr:polyhydroxyalkanoic acid system family protein [Usitatibacter sp.]
MADIELHRVHNLGLQAARAAADKMADQLGRKFDLKGEWEGNVLKFQRTGVTGSLAVTDKDLKLSVALGFLLKAMKGSIEQAVTHELDKLFAEAPAKPSGKTGVKPKTAPPSRKKAP